MKKKTLENPSAFAMCDENGFTQYGMTLRDYFASNAMQGILSENGYPKIKSEFESLCIMSFMIADEMLKQREIC